jgi:transposase
MPASYVKPHVKRQKNDTTDAEAIWDAVTRPTMRFVPVKSEDSKAC